jgi:F0F1-type ATP synthase membrane subunit b/b'
VPLRLSDLLERIRPVGAPGAPTEGESRREQAETDELAELARVLASLDAEADAIVADARRRAEEVGDDGARRAAQLRAELADRVAVAGAGGADPGEHAVDDEVAEMAAATDAEIDRRRRDATADTDRLVERAVDIVWALLDADELPRGAAAPAADREDAP